MFAYVDHGPYYRIVLLEGTKATEFASVSSEPLAARIVDLLNRNGLIDVPLPEPPPAAPDWEPDVVAPSWVRGVVRIFRGH